METRSVSGAATERVALAQRALWQLENQPEGAFRCGPMALFAVLEEKGATRDQLEVVASFDSTSRGTSMAQVLALAARAGTPMQAARRAPGAKVIVPSIVHWKAGHFAALTQESNGTYYAQDRTFASDTFVSRAALDEEGSGAYIVPAGPLPAGWTGMTPAETEEVWGKGGIGGRDGDGTGGGEPQGPHCKRKGMADYSILLQLASLRITDTPVWTSPGLGPAVNFEVAYVHAEAAQPSAFTYSNLGPKWTFDWLSYVEEGSGTVAVYMRGSGVVNRSTALAIGTSTDPDRKTQAILDRTGADTYVRRLPDGSREEFSYPVGVSPRKVFLTRIVDAQGQAVNLTWGVVEPSGTARLLQVTDALGRATYLEYELAGSGNGGRSRR